MVMLCYEEDIVSSELADRDDVAEAPTAAAAANIDPPPTIQAFGRVALSAVLVAVATDIDCEAHCLLSPLPIDAVPTRARGMAVAFAVSALGAALPK